MEVLSKEMIRQWILPALTFSAHSRPSVVEPAELVAVILYNRTYALDYTSAWMSGFWSNCRR